MPWRHKLERHRRHRRSRPIDRLSKRSDHPRFRVRRRSRSTQPDSPRRARRVHPHSSFLPVCGPRRRTRQHRTNSDARRHPSGAWRTAPFPSSTASVYPFGRSGATRRAPCTSICLSTRFRHCSKRTAEIGILTPSTVPSRSAPSTSPISSTLSTSACSRPSRVRSTPNSAGSLSTCSRPPPARTPISRSNHAYSSTSSFASSPRKSCATGVIHVHASGTPTI